MRFRSNRFVALAACAALLCACACRAGETAPGVVSHIKVVSDKVEDVSTLEDWKKAYIKDGMSDQDKAIAIWKTVVKYRHQTSPPKEFLQCGDCVHDPMKTIHVYGYGQCCCASSNVEGLARYVGLQARGRIINQHSVPEVFYDNEWHLVDGSLMNHFLRPDGKVASVDDLRKAVRGWFDASPDRKSLRGNDNALRKFALDEGWKKGPELLAGSTFYDKNGINAAGWHGWPSNMQEYDWSDEKAAEFEYGPAMGYELNIQLRQGERLTRNWFNKGWMVPGNAKDDLLNNRQGLGFQAKLGDIAPGRIGNGTLEYDVPLAGGAFKAGALTVDNLACQAEDNAAPALHVKDAAQPGVLIIRMPCSYVYLAGTAALKAVVPDGGSIAVALSDNQGSDWKDVAKVDKTGEQKLDLKQFVYLRYDYRLRFTLNGRGTGLDALTITNDIQHTQTPLPALAAGTNTLTFACGAQEGTITLAGNVDPDAAAGKQVSHLDYHPVINGMDRKLLRVGDSGAGEATYTLNTPGDIVRVRMNVFYRARDAKDGFEVQMSFDGGKTFKKTEDLAGPFKGCTKYFTCSDVPAGARQAQVKLVGRQRNTACVFDLRIDADYKEPNGGFRPVKVTYLWDEGGAEKKDVHVAQKPGETYTINCGAKPAMKSLIVELAQ
ncbi:MAG: hypothetical protein ABSE73_06295 [Planctomycetota bacterium]